MMLDIRNLKVSIPTDRGMLNAVRGVDLQIAEGETLCLVGESGCGKSLTATSIMGLLPRYAKVTSDRFDMAGQDLTTKTDAKLAKLRGRDVAMIFQDPTSALNPTLTIGRQLTEGVMRHENLTRKEADARAIEMLDRVGIANPAARLTQYPHGFSGGQRQRIMIASALMGRPKLLIADEPTTALDVTIQAQILQLLGELQADLGLSILLITHDLGLVAETVDRAMVMYAGRIVESGPVDALGIPTTFTEGSRFGEATSPDNFQQYIPGLDGLRAFQMAFGLQLFQHAFQIDPGRPLDAERLGDVSLGGQSGVFGDPVKDLGL